MKAIAILPKNKTEHKFISDLLKKLNVSTIPLDRESVEDICLSQLLKEVDKTKTVRKVSIVNKLKA